MVSGNKSFTELLLQTKIHATVPSNNIYIGGLVMLYGITTPWCACYIIQLWLMFISGCACTIDDKNHTSPLVFGSHYERGTCFTKVMWCFVNSLALSDIKWRLRTLSTLIQVMACYLSAPSHYLNQYWLIISKIMWFSPEGYFTENIQDIIRHDMLQNYSSKITTISLRGRWVHL